MGGSQTYASAQRKANKLSQSNSQAFSKDDQHEQYHQHQQQHQHQHQGSRRNIHSSDGTRLDASLSANHVLQSESKFVLADGSVFSGTQPFPAELGFAATIRPNDSLVQLTQTYNKNGNQSHNATSLRHGNSASGHLNLMDTIGSDDTATGDNDGFDVDRELRKNQRKWQLLQRLNDIQPNEAELQQVFTVTNNGSETSRTSFDFSRPSTGASVAHNRIGNTSKPVPTLQLGMNNPSSRPSSSNFRRSAGLVLESKGSGHDDSMEDLLYQQFGL